jgi:hypothetical protein
MSPRNWLDLVQLAQVEVTSEEAAHPIEAALLGDEQRDGWRASERGMQTIRLRFDAPQSLHLIRLVFDETERARTQEFALGWQRYGETTSHEIVRQQFTFNPPTTTREIEEYTVDLREVSILELQIRPDISDREARASLSTWRLA